MYGNDIPTGSTQYNIPTMSDPPEMLKGFSEMIERGEKIESRDWMPARYRNQLIRMISQHAHSEIIGMLPEGNWITRAPSLKRKIALLAKVQDEAGHGLYLYSAAETLGISRDTMTEHLLTRQAKYSNIFNYPTLAWADMGIIGWLVDGAAIINQTINSKNSFGPYARALIRICREEAFHKKQGMEIVATLATGTLEQKAMVQDSLNRWWWPTLMMFGPPDSDSTNSKETLEWKIKIQSNDEMRQRFIDMTVEQAHAFGLSIPDEDLRFNETTRHWEIGKIDWEEFFSVINGDGPCNEERLNAKRKAWEEGSWVRKAAKAHADRHSQQQRETNHS